jgi:hypothetical protein
MSKRRRVDGDSVLEINVGGTVFTTRKSTLMFESGSMLAKLFDEESPFGELSRDSSDRVFLDRDPQVFSVVLDYLRSAGRLVGATARSIDELSSVKEQADFFGLLGLIAAVDEILEERARTDAEVEKKRKEKEVFDAEVEKQCKKKEAEVEKKRKKKQAFDARARCVQYVHHLLGPHDGSDESERKRSLNQLKQFCVMDFRVHHTCVDAEGKDCDLIMGRELVRVPFYVDGSPTIGDTENWLPRAYFTADGDFDENLPAYRADGQNTLQMARYNEFNE